MTMKTTVILSLLLVLSACNEQGSSEASTDEAAKTSGNKFMNAAVTKIRAANPGFSANQATCVVEQMTADGSIGLGEINQMKLSSGGMQDNATHLKTAYQSAIQTCQNQ